MTSLMAWVGVDQRGPASFYIASDSRITWPQGHTWDYARKVFASSHYPDVLGYCGDVLFTSETLSQIVDLIDCAGIFDARHTAESKFALISEMIKEAHSTYPDSEQREFSLLHCSRRGEGMSSIFSLFELSWNAGVGWKSSTLPIPFSSGVARILGSGTAELQVQQYKWGKSEIGGTSRSVFSAFCDSIASGADSRTGGSPQLVGLYRKGAGEVIGTVYLGKSSLLGMPADGLVSPDRVEWRNELFERCDGGGKLLPGAQRHARPRKL
jgi:hypothetical protein